MLFAIYGALSFSLLSEKSIPASSGAVAAYLGADLALPPGSFPTFR